MSLTSYAWDSSVFIAWLGEEANAPLGDIDAVIQAIDDGAANLIVSVVTYSEILEVKYDENQMKKLDAFLRHSNVIKVDITIPVAKKAATIRSAGEAEVRKIKTPDALIIAAAILFKAEALHSRDRGILSLNGSQIVNGLTITEPHLPGSQRHLF